MRKGERKVLATVLALVMVLSTFLSSMGTFKAQAATEGVIAGWEFSTADLPVYATTGDEQGTAYITTNTGATPTIVTGNNLSSTNWDSGAGVKYWEFSVDTSSYTGITFTAKTRSSGTGPRDWKLIYSIDNGVSWTDVDDGGSAIESTTSLTQSYEGLALPKSVENCSNLLLRLVMTSDTSMNDGTVASNGTSRLADVYIKGSTENTDETVAPVTASPDSGKIEAGTAVSLATITEGASIYYNFDNGTSWHPYSDPINVDSLPKTIYVYASKDDVKSEVSTFDYIAKTEININDPITEDMIPEGVLQINEIYDNYDSSDTQIATVIGQVVYAYPSNAGGTNNTFIIQDIVNGQVYGLQIYDGSNTSKYTIGNIVTVKGTVSLYGGVMQISSVTDAAVLNDEVDKFPALEVTLAELKNSGDDYISKYIVISDVTLGAYSTGSITISDGTGTLSVYRGAAYPDGVSEGSVVDIYAVYSKYNTTYQLRVGSSSDYVLEGDETFDTSVSYTLANWAGSMAPSETTVYGDLYQANDYLDTDAELKLSTGSVPKAGSGNYLGSAGLGENGYYELKLSSELLGNLKLGYKMYGSGTGPRDFIILYSTDGVNYVKANDTTYSITCYCSLPPI